MLSLLIENRQLQLKSRPLPCFLTSKTGLSHSSAQASMQAGTYHQKLRRQATPWDV